MNAKERRERNKRSNETESQNPWKKQTRWNGRRESSQAPEHRNALTEWKLLDETEDIKEAERNGWEETPWSQ